MGAIFSYFKRIIPQSLIEAEALSVIDRDFKTRRSDEDMYRGDFGSSTYCGTLSLSPHTQNKRLSRDKREDLALEKLQACSKYRMYSVITRQVGYAYFTFGVKKLPVLRGGYELIQPNSLQTKTFKNITELKKFLENTTNPAWYHAAIYSPTSSKVLGTVTYKYFRNYQSKPKNPVAKYKMNSPMVEVIFGGWNPY